MNWVQRLSKAIQYIESHLTDDLSIDQIAGQAYSVSSTSSFLPLGHGSDRRRVTSRNRRL